MDIIGYKSSIFALVIDRISIQSYWYENSLVDTMLNIRWKRGGFWKRILEAIRLLEVTRLVWYLSLINGHCDLQFFHLYTINGSEINSIILT